jgi:hypothetical protein
MHHLQTEKVKSGSQIRLGLRLHLCRLKCDRVKPCLNCTKRGQPESCDYVKQDFSRSHPASLKETSNVHDRVKQLEDMVMALLNQQTNHDQDLSTSEKSPSANSFVGPVKDGGFTQSAPPSTPSQIDPNTPRASLGKLTRAEDQVNFVGSEHWEAILDDISELKIDLETPETSEIVDFTPNILFNMPHTPRSEIMSSIPLRPVCDMLISRWFKTMDMAPSKFTFLRSIWHKMRY